MGAGPGPCPGAWPPPTLPSWAEAPPDQGGGLAECTGQFFQWKRTHRYSVEGSTALPCGRTRKPLNLLPWALHTSPLCRPPSSTPLPTPGWVGTFADCHILDTSQPARGSPEPGTRSGRLWAPRPAQPGQVSGHLAKKCGCRQGKVEARTEGGQVGLASPKPPISHEQKVSPGPGGPPAEASAPGSLDRFSLPPLRGGGTPHKASTLYFNYSILFCNFNYIISGTLKNHR